MSDAFVAPFTAPAAPAAFAGKASLGGGSNGARPAAGIATTMVATPDRVVTSSSAYEPTEGPNAPLRVNNNGEVGFREATKVGLWGGVWRLGVEAGALAAGML